MRPVYLESPYAGDVPRNLAYARACVRDAILRGDAPLASHLLFTQDGILEDGAPAERRLGLECGFALAARCDATVVYDDLGISPGMDEGIVRAMREGRPVEFRSLGAPWSLLVEDDER